MPMSRWIARATWLGSLVHLLCLTLVLFAPQPGLAWNASGHRLVAHIAWEHLDAPARAASARLLRMHPDAGRWASRSRDDNPERGLFVEASTWADEIRQDVRFYSAGRDAPTPTLPGFPDMERRLDWHTVGYPMDAAAPEAMRGQLHRQLAALVEHAFAPVGAMRRSGDEQRHYDLPWLIHLVGDAHQPLHTTLRRKADGEWGRFGQGTTVNNPFNLRKPTSTLHEFWDDLPGPPGLRGERLAATARALMATHPPTPAKQGAASDWIKESRRIARGNGYPDSLDELPTLTKAFVEHSRAIADRRLAEAGYRLAAALNAAFRQSRAAHFQ